MSKNVEIKLLQPFPWFDLIITKLVLKKPSGLLFMKHGEPRFSVWTGDGAQYWIEKDDVIAAYVSELLTLDGEKQVDGGDAILRAMSLEDVLQVKDRLFGFFLAARMAISGASSTSSSSTDASSTPLPAGT